jgi:hypothetical protein
MCEDYSGERAKVTTVPTWLLKTTRNILKSMDWSRDAADRLVGCMQQPARGGGLLYSPAGITCVRRVGSQQRHCCRLGAGWGQLSKR